MYILITTFKPRYHNHHEHLHRKQNLDTEIFPVSHQLAVDSHFLRSRSNVPHRRNLRFPPLFVGWNRNTRVHHSLELFVYSLLFDTAFPLENWGIYSSHYHCSVYDKQLVDGSPIQGVMRK